MKNQKIKIVKFGFLKNLSLKIYTLFIILIAINGCYAQQGNSDSQPNIIFILTDDLGYGDLGVLYQNELALDLSSGIPRQFTPHLDKMSKEGALMPEHYSAAPVCAPSRASLLLGRSQGHANVRDNQFDKELDSNITIASALKEAGYATAAIGKWGLQGRSDDKPNWPAHPLNRGFDYYLGYIRHGDGHEHYPKEGLYRGSKEVYENRENITPDLDKCYTTDLWTAATKRWIVNHKNSADKDKPFFVYLAYDTPHAVLELPTQAYPDGGGLNGGLQWTGKPGSMINTASGTIDSWIHPDYNNATYDDDGNATTSQKEWPNVYKRYATDVRRIDSAVGDLLQLLKDLNIDENTMVVFTSDNGPSVESYLKDQPIEPTFFKSYGPFDGIKRDCWEGGLRMPTLTRWPGTIKKDITVKTPSISYDWLPTFVEIAGLPAPALSDGVSLMPSLTQQGDQQPSAIYVEYFQNGKTPGFEEFSKNHRGRERKQMQMLRMGDLVGVRYNIQSHKDDFEIYNVKDDPQQTNNLSSTPNMEAFQQQLKDRTLQMRMPNRTAVRPYDKEYVPAVNGDNLKKGLHWKAYEENFPWVPQITSLTPAATGNSDIPSPEIDTEVDYKNLYFEGYLKVPENDTYTFYLTSDNEGLLRIHDAVVIDAGNEYFAKTQKSGTIKLEGGLHPFRLYTKHGNRNKKINLEWSKGTSTPETIPASAFYSSKT